MHLDNFDVKNNSICTNKFVFVISSYAVKIIQISEKLSFSKKSKNIIVNWRIANA